MTLPRLPRLILLQGPPKVGKDSLGQLIHARFGHEPAKFASPIRDVVSAVWGVNDDEIDKWKGEQIIQDGTSTGRDFMIAFSEKFMKPMFGPYIFGYLMEQEIRTQMEYLGDGVPKVVITDSGFVEESAQLIEGGLYDLDEVLAIHLYRNGCTFAGDSRSYWSMPNLKIMSFNAGEDSLEVAHQRFLKEFEQVTK